MKQRSAFGNRRARSAVATITGTALIVTALAGCAPAATSGDGVLSIQSPWAESNPFYAPFQEIVDEYKAANPDVTVEVTITSIDQNQDIFTNSVLAGDPPDILIADPTGDGLSWVEQGATVPVSDYLEEWGLGSAIIEQAQNEASWLTADGELRGFPLVGFVWPTWYNTTLLDEVGASVPVTEDDVRDFVSKVSADRSVIVGGTDWSGFNAFLQTLQVYIDDEEFNTLAAEGGWAASETARKGVEWFTTLRDLGYWSKNSTGLTVDGATASFFGGESVGLDLISEFFAAAPPELAPNVALGGIPIPDDARVDKPVVMAGYNGLGVMISANGAATDLDLVESFVREVYKPASISKFVDQAGLVAAAESDSSSTPVNLLLAQANGSGFLDSVTLVIPSVIPANVVENLTRAGSLAWTEGATVDQILEAMDAVY